LSAKSRIWKFGDDINTDLIIPGRYLDNYDPAHLAAHAMEGVSKGFSKKVSKGDIIVAGRNFGCGSSREQAVIALKCAGISAIVAQSFARIFFRNAINLGLPVIVSSDAHKRLVEGDRVTIDLRNLVMTASDGGKTFKLDPMPGHLQEILDAGGLVPYIKARLERKT
jgi:3-isopropylmalate/(R)-2-methylmalate dehydratase small subunit